MRESMARLAPQFSAARAVREYTGQHYLPAAAAYRERAANQGTVARQLVARRHEIEKGRSALRFGESNVQTHGDRHTFEVQVYLDDLDPNQLRVELYADGIEGSAPFRQEMTRLRQLIGSSGGYAYGAEVPATRPAGDYTARVIPSGASGTVPLEAAQILWQR
jgi:starch phosphorylase